MPEHETPQPAEGAAVPDPGETAPVPADDAPSMAIDGEDWQDAPERAGRGTPWPVLLALAVVPAVIVGLAVWFFAPGGSSSGRSGQDVASVLNAFSAQPNTTTRRFEGQLPPGFPAGVPRYPGAHIVSSLLQIRGADAAYLVVYDTGAAQDTVAKYYQDKLNADPWQLQGGQSDTNGALHQFSDIKDPSLSGLVLISSSVGGNVTTILESVTVIGGAKAAGTQAYAPGPSKALPAGFPAGIQPYPGSITTSAAYRKQPQGSSYIVTFVTKDAADKVLDYYRKQLAANGWTVQDSTPLSPPAATPTQAATAITFKDSTSKISGSITTGTVAQDASYTSIDVQVSVGTAGAGGN